MGTIVLGLTALVLFALLFVFTGLNKNSAVQQYETTFSLCKVFNIRLKVDKRKTTKQNTHGSLSKPR